MVFIMPKLVNFKRCIGLALLFTSITQPVLAETTLIKHAELKRQGDQYVLNADIDYPLTETARQALHHGIPLSWKIVLIIQRNNGLWKSTVKEITLYNRLHYLTLLNIYRIDSNIQPTGRYSTLSSALHALGRIRDIHIMNKRALQPGITYDVALKARFDKEALPLPLRPEAWFSQAWSLSSDWFKWAVLRPKKMEK